MAKKKKPLAGFRDVETGSSCAPVGKGRAIRVCVSKPNKRGPLVTSSMSACEVLRNMQNLDRESFVALHLDGKKRVIGMEEIAKGQVSGVSVSPGEVFKSALLTNASSIIVAHNHPSGDPEPSREDYLLTQRLVEAGKLIGVPVLDHIVVGDDDCKSFREKYSSIFEGLGKRRKRR